MKKKDRSTSLIDKSNESNMEQSTRRVTRRSITAAEIIKGKEEMETSTTTNSNKSDDNSKQKRMSLIAKSFQKEVYDDKKKDEEVKANEKQTESVETSATKKRGRPKKIDSTVLAAVNNNKPETEKKRKKRGPYKKRGSSLSTSPESDENLSKPKRNNSKKSKEPHKLNDSTEIKATKRNKVYAYESEEESQSDEDSDSDEDFTIENEKEVLSSLSSEEKVEDDDDNVDKDDLDVIKKRSSKKLSPKTTRRTPIKKKKFVIDDDEGEASESISGQTNEIVQIDSFDKDKRIEKWEYELDEETNFFTKPILPNLSEKALSQFLSSKSSKQPSKKLIIYECPFCQRIFTYQLVFNNHLFTCPDNKNVPEYILYCSKNATCEFTSKKKQDMISHFVDYHSNKPPKIHKKEVTNSENDDADDDNYDDDNIKAKLSTTKKEQLEISRYYFLNRKEFKYAHTYFDQIIGNKYKQLKLVDEYFNHSHKSKEDKFVINAKLVSNINSSASDIKNELNFLLCDNEHQSVNIKVKPFEVYNHSSKNNSFKILNVINQITAMDWSFRKYSKHNESQYLAFSTLPLNGLSKLKLQALFESENLIYIYKFNDLNSSETKSEPFALINQTIGHINCLKWRPDYGASDTSTNNDKFPFIGYLLAASSNGNAYIYHVDDLTSSNKKADNSISNILNVYEPTREIILRPSFLFGQCTSADWSHLNGATQIAIGYANGSVALFNLSSTWLKDKFASQANEKQLFVEPIKTFSAHFTFIKTLKWSKLNEFIIATGSLFSREIKIWDTRNIDKKPLLEYEILISDFVFSLHCSDLFMIKEANLKGTNHLSALDLNFNIYNKDKDESRAHSSLFYTTSTMNSLDQSDYLNKIIICSNDGTIQLTRSNDSKHWTQKNKLMSYSFAQIAKFSVIADSIDDAKTSKMYDITTLNSAKTKSLIKIDLERITNNKQNKDPKKQNWRDDQNVINPLNIGLNSLVKICWNPNVNYKNWYASASQSGFIFIHRLNELNESVKDLLI